MSRDDSVNDWNSRSALEGDRFDQLESQFIRQYQTRPQIPRRKGKDGRAQRDLSEYRKRCLRTFRDPREEMKRGLLNWRRLKGDYNLYNNLGMVFNEHMRVQGLELIKLQEHLLAGFHEAVAAIKEEGRVSRAKDSEDRLKLYEAISEVHKETNTIRRALEQADWHPYNRRLFSSEFCGS
ncbi:hypothetical protein BGX38DRAFT_1272384 [Terfezia claveryi]|nr:hypothetical protein BGX38DRAFT_1272384 [Terfezia claveryi]